MEQVLPIPPFNVLEFIDRETSGFINAKLSPRTYALQDDTLLNEFLWSLKEEHRLQALVKIINTCISVLEIHKRGDKTSIKRKLPCHIENCAYERGIQKTLYYLYNKLDDYGINPYEDSFTTDEVYDNNIKLDKILDEIKLLKAGQEIIFDEVIESSIEQAKDLQVLGKQKWHNFMFGIAIQLATQAVFQNLFDNHFLVYFQQFRNGLQRFLN